MFWKSRDQLSGTGTQRRRRGKEIAKSENSQMAVADFGAAGTSIEGSGCFSEGFSSIPACLYTQAPCIYTIHTLGVLVKPNFQPVNIVFENRHHFEDEEIGLPMAQRAIPLNISPWRKEVSPYHSVYLNRGKAGGWTKRKI